MTRIDPRLLAKWKAEYEEMERKRKADGLPPLTTEQARQQGFKDGLQDVKSIHQGTADSLTEQHRRTSHIQAAQTARATRERAVLWTLSMRLTVLFILLAIGFATCGRILLR